MSMNSMYYLPRVEIGGLQYSDVVLNLAPDTAQMNSIELLSDAQ